jgi:carbamoyltransferase
MLNLKVKKRESFRPFAPILLEEEFELYFGQKYASPYMLFAHKIKESFRKPFDLNSNLIESINQTRSPFPAVTHVDFSSRIQTVNKDSNPELFQLLVNFKSKTGFGILVNTSFNIKDEPIVCTPMDAINCFNNTEIDVLIMNNFIFRKN